jgi:hypothetical protein
MRQVALLLWVLGFVLGESPSKEDVIGDLVNKTIKEIGNTTQTVVDQTEDQAKKTAQDIKERSKKFSKDITEKSTSIFGDFVGLIQGIVGDVLGFFRILFGDNTPGQPAMPETAQTAAPAESRLGTKVLGLLVLGVLSYVANEIVKRQTEIERKKTDGDFYRNILEENFL